MIQIHRIFLFGWAILATWALIKFIEDVSSVAWFSIFLSVLIPLASSYFARKRAYESGFYSILIWSLCGVAALISGAQSVMFSNIPAFSVFIPMASGLLWMGFSKANLRKKQG